MLATRAEYRLGPREMIPPADFASPDPPVRLSVVIPCWNDGPVLGPCLESLIGQRPMPEAAEVIVVLNGCTDESRAVAGRLAPALRRAGLGVRIVELARPSKSLALNAGDRAARGPMRVYLDADVVLAPDLLARLAAALDTRAPRYATGTLVVAPPRSRVTAAYGKFWSALTLREVNGIGLYAVNAAGRARWGRFPPMHSDDKFVRLSFLPVERVRVDARYLWPLPEGWRRLVSVRLRWTEGNLELKRRYPAMTRPQTRARRPWVYAETALRDPVGFLVFTSVYVACWILARPGVDTEGTAWRRAR